MPGGGTQPAIPSSHQHEQKQTSNTDTKLPSTTAYIQPTPSREPGADKQARRPPNQRRSSNIVDLSQRDSSQHHSRDHSENGDQRSSSPFDLTSSPTSLLKANERKLASDGARDLSLVTADLSSLRNGSDPVKRPVAVRRGHSMGSTNDADKNSSLRDAALFSRSDQQQGSSLIHRNSSEKATVGHGSSSSQRDVFGACKPILLNTSGEQQRSKISQAEDSLILHSRSSKDGSGPAAQRDSSSFTNVRTGKVMFTTTTVISSEASSQPGSDAFQDAISSVEHFVASTSSSAQAKGKLRARSVSPAPQKLSISSSPASAVANYGSDDPHSPVRKVTQAPTGLVGMSPDVPKSAESHSTSQASIVGWKDLQRSARERADLSDVSAHLQSIIFQHEKRFELSRSGLKIQHPADTSSQASSDGSPNSSSSQQPRCSTPISASFHQPVPSYSPHDVKMKSPNDSPEQMQLDPSRPVLQRGVSLVAVPNNKERPERPTPMIRAASWMPPSPTKREFLPSSHPPVGDDVHEAEHPLPSTAAGAALSPIVPPFIPTGLLGSETPSPPARFEHHRSPPSPPPLDPLLNVYVSNLPASTTDASLFALGLAVGGHITSHKAIIDPDTGDCKGYGFIMFSTLADAERSIASLNQLGFQASRARESFSARLRRCADKDSNNLYFHGIPRFYKQTEVAQLIAPVRIASMRILKDSQGNSRGIALIRVESREIAAEIIEKYNDMIFPSGEKLVVRFADSEAQRELKRNVIPLGSGRQSVDVSRLRSSVSLSGLFGAFSPPYSAPPTLGSFSPAPYTSYAQLVDQIASSSLPASPVWPSFSSPLAQFFPQTPESLASNSAFSSLFPSTLTDTLSQYTTPETTMPSASGLVRSQSLQEAISDRVDQPVPKSSSVPTTLISSSSSNSALHIRRETPHLSINMALAGFSPSPSTGLMPNAGVPKLAISMPSSDDLMRIAAYSPQAVSEASQDPAKSTSPLSSVFHLPASEADDLNAVSRSSPPRGPGVVAEAGEAAAAKADAPGMTSRRRGNFHGSGRGRRFRAKASPREDIAPTTSRPHVRVNLGRSQQQK